MVEVDEAQSQPRFTGRCITEHSKSDAAAVELHQRGCNMRIGLEGGLASAAVGNDACRQDPVVDAAKHIRQQLVEHLLIFDALFLIDGIDMRPDLIEREGYPGIHHGADGSIDGLALHTHEVYQGVVEVEDDGFDVFHAAKVRLRLRKFVP